MFYLLSYDISNDKLRLKVSMHLLASGCIRLQKSVFIAPNYKSKEFFLLKKQVLKLINDHQKTDNDSFLCFKITPKQLPDIWWQTPNPKITFENQASEWF
ncbi:MAG: CRISPR-associated endonuclease Cas2 [Saprospiraceae bacterium]